jgi:hypothetical protein
MQGGGDPPHARIARLFRRKARKSAGADDFKKNLKFFQISSCNLQ